MDIGVFKVMNQDFVKWDRFDGTNFTQWQDKMMFLCTALKISNVLDPNLQPFPEPSDKDIDNIKANWKKREEDDIVSRGHILNTLSDDRMTFSLQWSPQDKFSRLTLQWFMEKLLHTPEDFTFRANSKHLRKEARIRERIFWTTGLKYTI